MKEIWKDIEGYEGLYQVSNKGRIKSLTRIIYDEKNDRNYWLNGKILKQFDNGNGYMIVHLRKNNQRYVKYVHRLVSKAFLKDYDENKTINHKDFNRSNNNINNLECCTLQENLDYSRINGRYKDFKIIILEKRKDRVNNKKKNLKHEIIELRKSGMSIQKISRKVHLKCEYVKEIIVKNKIDPIVKIKCLETNELFDTIKDANLKYGVTTIKDCLSGRQKTSAGFHWERIVQCRIN